MVIEAEGSAAPEASNTRPCRTARICAPAGAAVQSSTARVTRRRRQPVPTRKPIFLNSTIMEYFSCGQADQLPPEVWGMVVAQTSSNAMSSAISSDTARVLLVDDNEAIL